MWTVVWGLLGFQKDGSQGHALLQQAPGQTSGLHRQEGGHGLWQDPSGSTATSFFNVSEHPWEHVRR